MESVTLCKIISKLNVHSRRKRNVIVLMRLDALGDFVLWQDAAKEFKKKYTETPIVLICAEANVELARTISYFGRVIGVDVKRLEKSNWYLLKMWLKLQRLRGAHLIQSVYSRNKMMDIVSAMIPAYKKITVSTDIVKTAIDEKNSNGIYDIIKRVSPKWEHELLKNARFMRQLGFKEFKASLPVLPDCSWGETGSNKPYYVIVLGTNKEERTWASDNYAKVAQYIYEKYAIECYLLGVKQDLPLSDNMLRKCGDIPIVNLIAKTTIPEYVQIIRNAEFVISGDTSATHIAAATRTKSIAVGGGWHYERFLPYALEIAGDKTYFPRLCYVPMDCYYCNQKKYPPSCKRDQLHKGKWTCILAVTPEMVIEKVDEVMEEYANSI